jgi:OOP family OmpA-OmpF porin
LFLLFEIHSMTRSNNLHPRIAQSALLLLLPLAALAQNSVKEGYVLDGSGAFVHSATTGQCWHTGEWTPALAQEGCDPLLQIAATPPVAVTAAPRAVPEAAPVAAAPAPKAVPVIVPVAAQKMRYSTDALFGFDRAVVGPKGKQALDEASVKIQGLTGEKVRVVGHADRIGSSAYNQKLSTQRAYAVRDYLAFKGVPLDRMEATGVGETDPVTKPGECAGGQSAKVIACLQPDRRVDVEMQGTALAQ